MVTAHDKLIESHYTVKLACVYNLYVAGPYKLDTPL